MSSTGLLELLLPSTTSRGVIYCEGALISPEAPAQLINSATSTALDIAQQVGLSKDAPSDVNFLTGKRLLPDQATFFGHMHPSAVSMQLVKHSVLRFFNRLSEVVVMLEELESEDPSKADNMDVRDILSVFRYSNTYNLWNGFISNVKVGVIRDLTISSVQRLYEALALDNLSPKQGRKLIKNLVTSSVRKSERYATKSVLAKKVLISSFNAQAMYWAAFFTVTQAFDTYFTFVAKTLPVQEIQQVAPGNPLGVKVDGYSTRLVKNLVRSAGGCALAAVGAAIGAMIKPGTGSFIGAMVLPQVIFVVIV